LGRSEHEQERDNVGGRETFGDTFKSAWNNSLVPASLLWTFKSFQSSFLLFGGVGGERRGGEGLSMIELERFEGGEFESEEISVGRDMDCEVAEDS
jgi:hypothetical protein